MDTTKAAKKPFDRTFGVAMVLSSLICLVIGLGLNGKENFPTLMLFGALYGAFGVTGAYSLLKYHHPYYCDKYDWTDKH